MKMTDTGEPELILTQEPYEYQNRPSGINKKSRMFTAGKGKHRAAIITVNSNTDAILITKLSDEVTLLVEIIHENLKFFPVSKYFDLEDQGENNFTKMDELMRFVKDGRILIEADSNSRSKTWHDLETNSTGNKLEEYLASKHLHILNEETDRSNFLNGRESSNIDLTIIDNDLIAAINEWEISEKRAFPTTIIFNIKSAKEEPANRKTTTQDRLLVLL